MDQKEVIKSTSFFGLSRNIISIGIVSFLNDLSSDMIFPFIPIFLVSELHTGAIVADLVEERFRATAYGIYNAFTGFALLPASLVFGFFWDRYGASFSFQYRALLGIIAFALFLALRIVNHRAVKTREVELP